MTWNESLSEATRYEVAQHARNRVALALVFIPVWLTLVQVIILSGPVSFYHNVTGRFAKLVALALATEVVSLYATLVTVLFWGPDLVVAFYLSLALSGLTYGGIGILLGVLFRTELAGMFLIIMISLVDVMVQNPIIAPSTRSGAVSLLPTYGAMQNAVGAAFTGDLSPGYFLLGLLWLAERP